MRKVVITLVVLLVLLGLGAFAVSNFNTYLQNNREWLAEQASAALGRTVRFEEIGVSFTGGLGARVGELSIGDDPAFAKEDFLKVGRANVVAKILPALSGRYEVARVVLEAPQVTVIRSMGGFNFDSIGKKEGAAARGEAGAGAAELSQALPLLVSVLRISDGVLRFVDRTKSPQSEMVIDHLDFAASDVGFDTPVHLDLAATVLGAADQNVHVAGTVGPLGSPERAMQAPLDLDAKLGPVIIDRAKKLPIFGASIPALLSSSDPMAISVEVTGTLDVPKVAMSFDGTGAGLLYGKVFRKPAGTRFSVEAEVAQSANQIDVSGFVLRLAEATFQGGGTVGMGTARPIDFKISGRGVPLDGWGALFAAAEGIDVGGTLDLDVHAVGPTSSGPPPLNGTVSLHGVRAKQPGGGIEISDLTTQLNLKGDRVEIPPTQFKVAGEPVTLSATVTSLKNLAAEFALTASQLRLAAIGAGGEGVKSEEILKDLDVKGTVKSAANGPQVRATVRSSGGSLRDVSYSNLDAGVGVVDRVAELKNVSLKTFDGLVTGNGTYDMSNPENPVFAFRGRVNGLSVASLVDYLGLGSVVKMTGKMNGDIQLDGSGKDKDQITKALTGTGSLAVEDGLLQGVNIAESVLTSITGVPGLSNLIGPKIREKYRVMFADAETAFDALGTKLNIADGALHLQETELAAHDYSLRGDGSISFENVLDIGASFLASPELTRDLLGNVKELQYLVDPEGRLMIPLRLSGALPSIRPSPDTQYVAKQIGGALLTKGLEKGLDALFGKQQKQAQAPAGQEAEAPVAEEGGDPAIPTGSEPQPVKLEDAAKRLLGIGRQAREERAPAAEEVEVQAAQNVEVQGAEEAKVPVAEDRGEAAQPTGQEPQPVKPEEAAKQLLRGEVGGLLGGGK